MIAIFQNSLENEIDGVGGVEREDDAQRVVGIKMATDCLAACIDVLCRGKRQWVRAAPGISALLAHTEHGGFVNAGGFWKAGGGVIKIDESQI